MFFQRLKLNISSISHQQAVAERWDLPNIEIFQSKDVASSHRLNLCCHPTQRCDSVMAAEFSQSFTNFVNGIRLKY
jgi:hypothetical protein